MNVAFFVSGGGGFAKSVFFKKDKNLAVEIKFVIVDRICGGYNFFSEETDIPTYLVDYNSFGTRIQAEKEILKICLKHKIELVCLTYQRILSPFFLENFKIPIVNLHPAILPMFIGLNSMERAYKSDTLFHGSTIHYVTEELDMGPILSQFVCARVHGENKADFLHRHFSLSVVLLLETLYRLREKKSFDLGAALIESEPFGQAFFSSNLSFEISEYLP